MVTTDPAPDPECDSIEFVTDPQEIRFVLLLRRMTQKQHAMLMAFIATLW
jgi:hypothetical protein